MKCMSLFEDRRCRPWLYLLYVFNLNYCDWLCYPLCAFCFHDFSFVYLHVNDIALQGIGSSCFSQCANDIIEYHVMKSFRFV